MLTNEADRTVRLRAIGETYAGATFELWGGDDIPDDANAIPNGFKIGVEVLPAPAFTFANGKLTKAGAWVIDGATQGGVPRFFRLIAKNGARRQGTAGMVGSGAQLIVGDRANPGATQIHKGRRVEVMTVSFGYSTGPLRISGGRPGTVFGNFISGGAP